MKKILLCLICACTLTPVFAQKIRKAEVDKFTKETKVITSTESLFTVPGLSGYRANYKIIKVKAPLYI